MNLVIAPKWLQEEGKVFLTSSNLTATHGLIAYSSIPDGNAAILRFDDFIRKGSNTFGEITRALEIASPPDRHRRLPRQRQGAGKL